MNTYRQLCTIPGTSRFYREPEPVATEPIASQTVDITPAKMRLGGITDLIQALGGKVGRTYASELKRAAGMNGNRLFDIDAVVKWRQEHPSWKIPTQRRRNYPQH